MILGLLLKRDELLLTIRSGHDSWEFRRCNVNWTDSEETSERGFIWNRVDDDLRRAYLDADTVAVALPAARCMVKRLEIDKKLEDENPGYRKWRAGIELPGDADLFGYGFVSSTQDSEGGKCEMIFFAAPADYLHHLSRALIREDDSREIQFIPEQIGLFWLASKSAGDYDQVALVHFDRQDAVVIVLRDGRFFKGRYFRSTGDCNDEIAVDIETFLLSVAASDESFPLIMTGSAGKSKIEWDPLLPAFLGERDLDYSSVWGVTEFIAGGGRCELQAGL